jgi:hypothetical protein
MKKSGVINIDVYDVKVYVLIGYSPSDIRKFTNNEDIIDAMPDNDKDSVTIGVGGDSRDIIVFISKLHSSDELLFINTVAHESYHIASELLFDIGYSFCNNDSNEPAAWLIGYITEAIYGIRKKGKCSDKLWIP